MATSAELLKAIKGGAEVRIVFSSGDHGHTALEYSPRYKGDRQPWVKHVGSEAERYSAGQCAAVYPKVAIEQETAPVMGEEFDAKAAPVKRAPRVIDVPACICPVRTDYHSLDCMTFRAAHSATDTEENDNVSIKEGPLTERQIHILNHLRAGKRHEEIAPMLAPAPGYSSIPQAVTVSVVKQECQHIRVKFGTSTVMQAVSLWSMAQAYREAATLIDADRPLHPESDEVDGHVWHVLTGLSKILRERADRLTPR